MIFHAIGLMSGTSLDGLDICYSRFIKNIDDDFWTFQLLNTETLPYNDYWENQLKNALYLSAENLQELNANYGFYLGEKVNDFIRKHAITKVDVISSHGHTIFHQPEKKFTTQIGDGRAIKIFTQIPVVYDIRSQDVLLGGNGAPLVPIGDQLLFSAYDACFNLGGFSNVSLVLDKKRIGFDVCPVNIAMNFYAKKLNKNYDDKGEIARNNKVDYIKLNNLNQLDFYQQLPPKSLGIEWVIKNIFPVLHTCKPEIALATLTEHAAEKIAEVLEKYQLKKVLFTGGGAYNDFLIEKIKEKTNSQLILPNEEIINYKEALIFAFMGVLRINNINNVLSSVTGSSQDHCSGILV